MAQSGHCLLFLPFFLNDGFPKFLLFTPQGSLSLVVPDQMHWRGYADFPKVINNDHGIEAFGLQFN